MGEELDITVSDRGNIKILECKGRIDGNTSSILESKINEVLVSKNYRIIVDLGRVDYISSAGWGIFISEIKDIRKNKGDIKLASMKNEVMPIFEHLGFASIFKYYKDTDEAVKKFK